MCGWWVKREEVKEKVMRLEILNKFRDHDCVRKCLVLMHMCTKLKVSVIYKNDLASSRVKMVVGYK